MDVDTNENQRPQADSRADDDEFNLANYDDEGRGDKEEKSESVLIELYFQIPPH